MSIKVQDKKPTVLPKAEGSVGGLPKREKRSPVAQEEMNLKPPEKKNTKLLEKSRVGSKGLLPSGPIKLTDVDTSAKIVIETIGKHKNDLVAIRAAKEMGRGCGVVRFEGEYYVIDAHNMRKIGDPLDLKIDSHVLRQVYAPE